MYCYIQSEPQLWTVGFYSPDGVWNPESDHTDKEAAAERVAWLNGSRPTLPPSVQEALNSHETHAIGNVLFTAKSLDGEQIEMSFSEISTKYTDDDVFYYNNGIGEPVACLLSSLSVVLP